MVLVVMNKDSQKKSARQHENLEIMAKGEKDSFFLPDFCSIPMVFAVVIIGELLAFILTLGSFRGTADSWNDLALLSLLIQWQGLSISAVLCVLRKRLSHLNSYLAVSLIVLAILFCIGFISEIAFTIQKNLALSIISSSVSHWEFLLHSLLIGGIISLSALRYFYVKHQLVLQIKAESEAQLQALQWRIRPHFLFNSMNTIISLIRRQPVVAERLLENFSELFRYVLKEKAPLVSLEEELGLLKNYLQIEQLRLDERLVVNWNMDNLPKDAMIPVMTLQPLIENAIYHGIETSLTGGKLEISGCRKGEMIEIMITNPWQDEVSSQAHRKGNQIAMENISKRLQWHYSDQAALSLTKKAQSCRVLLKFPYSISKND